MKAIELVKKCYAEGVQNRMFTVKVDGVETTLCIHSFPPYIPLKVYETYDAEKRRVLEEAEVIQEVLVTRDFDVEIRLSSENKKGQGVLKFSFEKGKDGVFSVTLSYEGVTVACVNGWPKAGKMTEEVIATAIGHSVLAFMDQASF